MREGSLLLLEGTASSTSTKPTQKTQLLKNQPEHVEVDFELQRNMPVRFCSTPSYNVFAKREIKMLQLFEETSCD
jgi:hypothetical protein